MKVPFYEHDLDQSQAEKIGKVLASPILTTGPVGRQVEEQLRAFFGTSHALLVNSWTNGALAALLAIDLQAGDEVIVPAMTFIATANVVELLGATPVFADVDPRTLLLTPDGVRKHLSNRTKAVIPVHLYGQMCDVASMREMLRQRPDVRIIEDCAHCFEGTRDGYGPGTHSDAAIFSFYATKNVTCGEGGAIVTSDPDLHQRLLQTRLHGMSATAVDRYKGNRYQHWEMERLGVKANLPDLLAALLPDQIDTIRARLPVRHRLAEAYRAAFADGPLRLAACEPGVESAEHLFTIHVPGNVRDEAIGLLNEAGIGVTVNYRAVPSMAYYERRYGYGKGDFPASYEWGEGTITLPLYPSMSAEQQDYVIATVRERVYTLCRKVSGMAVSPPSHS